MITRLIALYPRRWRERYGAELAELIADNPIGYGRLRLALDVVRGALDAHLQRRPDMSRLTADPAVRRGALDGLIVASVMTVVLFLTNVVFPAGPNESDDDPEYLVQLAAGYALLLVLFLLIGARARRRSDSQWAGAKGGAAAGLVVALVVLVVSFTIDNAFFSIVSQQHDKRVAFEASGWSSMRAFVNAQILYGAVTVTPLATLVGGLLGLAGGALRAPRGPRTQGVSAR